MPAFSNLSFETWQGGYAGLALSWGMSYVASAVTIAGYLRAAGDPNEYPSESFEAGWDNDTYNTTLPAVVAAEYDVVPEPREDFEEGWDNDVYNTTLPAPSPATYADAQNFEDFTGGWGNDAYLTEFTGGELTAAVYDSAPEAYEDFEEDWNNGGLFILTPAQYDGNAEAYEDFEEVRPEVTFVADPSDDSLNAPGHLFQADDRVRVKAGTNLGDSLPTGLNAATDYYIRDVVGNLVQLSLTSGGAVVDFTDAGVGTHRILSTEVILYWTGETPTI